MELKRGGVPDFIQLIPKSLKPFCFFLSHDYTSQPHFSFPCSLSRYVQPSRRPTPADLYRFSPRSMPQQLLAVVVPVLALEFLTNAASPTALFFTPSPHRHWRRRHLKTLHRQLPVPNSSFPLWFEASVWEGEKPKPHCFKISIVWLHKFWMLIWIQSKIVICVVDVMNLLGFVKVIELVGVDFLKIYLWLSWCWM